jgi:hypothetical protein
MADESDDQQTQGSQETAVGHHVVDEPGTRPVGGDPAAQPLSADPTPAPDAAQPAGGDATEVFFSRDQAQQDPTVTTPPTPPPPSDERTGGGSSPAEADRIAADQEDPFAQKPHVYVFGAFFGAFAVAQILKRITGGGDD